MEAPRLGRWRRSLVIQGSPPHLATSDSVIHPADLLSVWRYARQTVLDQLAEHIDDPGLLEVLAVVVSEATTNTTIHAPGPCELRIISHGGLPLVLEIADTGDQLDVIAARLAAGAVPDQLGALLDGGRGLGIIARLSGGHCAVHPTRLYSAPADGKSVWFAINGHAP